MKWFLFFVICAGSSVPVFADDQISAEHREFLETKIRPVLVKHCYECHSADAAKSNKLKAALLLDSRDGIRKGGESGAVLDPGKPAASLLMSALNYDGLEMPPKGKLPAETIADF